MEVVPVDKTVVDSVEKEISEAEVSDFKNLHRLSSEDASKRDVDDFVQYNPMEKFDGEQECVQPVRPESMSDHDGRESIDNSVLPKRKPGRPKTIESVEKQFPKIPKKRGRPKRILSDVPLKSLSELLRTDHKAPARPIGKQGKHELSRVLKSRMKTDIETVGTGVLTRAQRKKLVGLFLRDTGSGNDVENIFVTKDDVKLKECKDGPKFNEPKKKEWQAWQDNQSFGWVKDEGQARVKC